MTIKLFWVSCAFKQYNLKEVNGQWRAICVVLLPSKEVKKKKKKDNV